MEDERGSKPSVSVKLSQHALKSTEGTKTCGIRQEVDADDYVSETVVTAAVPVWLGPSQDLYSRQMSGIKPESGLD